VHHQDNVVPFSLLDPYFSLKNLSAYSDLSVRTLRTLLSRPVNPLPHYRLDGKILIKKSEFDTWLIQYRRASPPQDLDTIVNDILRGL
jgi:hypothetical protein